MEGEHKIRPSIPGKYPAGTGLALDAPTDAKERSVAVKDFWTVERR